MQQSVNKTAVPQDIVSRIRNVTARDYKKACFQGINENRQVCDLLCFAHAEVG